MSETKTDPIQEFEYKAEMKQLLHLIVHSLYTHPEIFLRELISNAADALNKLRFRELTEKDLVDAGQELKIEIKLDVDHNKLIVEDNGVGMTYDDLVERIGTVASSGTLAFLEQLKEAGKPIDAQLIGQFGVGFYSAFMVSDTITIETRYADPDSKAYRWQSDGEGTFTIEEVDRTRRGTTITLNLKEDQKEFAQDYRVKQVIQKYSNFVDFPILVEDTQVNTVKALWQKGKNEVSDEEREEFYKFISNDYASPLGHLHLTIEGRVNFKALLFIPSVAPPNIFREEYHRTLHLYSNDVFIQDDCRALLPEYLRFVRGVVDTEDLPLNISREVTQSSPMMAKINKILVGKVMGLLDDWAQNDPDKYEAFYKNYGQLFKTGVNEDFSHRDQIIELLRYESTSTEKGKTTSMKAYVDRMTDEQKEIYYLMGDHRDLVERNPNLEYFKKHNIEVLFLIDPVDVFTFPAINTYKEKTIKSIEKADLDLKQDSEIEKESLDNKEANPLLARFRVVLGDKIEDVVASKRLVESAVTLVVGEKGMDTQMERMMKYMNQEFSAGSKILEVNTAHPLIKNMARLHEEGGNDELLENIIHQLFEGVLLIEGNLTQPSTFVERMTSLMTDATK